MKKYLYLITVAAVMMFAATSCDRSDSDNSYEVPSKPVFDAAKSSTAFAAQAQHLYDTYGLWCHTDFEEIDYLYELTTTDLYTKYAPVDDFAAATEALNFFESKVLKLFPVEVVKKSFAHLFVCGQVIDTYTRSVSKGTSNTNSSTTDTYIDQDIPMRVKKLGVAIGFAGSAFAEADKDLLQMQWIEAVVETMLNNSPTPTEFNNVSMFDVQSVTGSSSYSNPYSASKVYGYYCLKLENLHKWGFLDAPNVGLQTLRFAKDGVTETNESVTMGRSRWYDTGYTQPMDFAIYAANIMLHPDKVAALGEEFPLIAQKAALVKEYMQTNFKWDLTPKN